MKIVVEEKLISDDLTKFWELENLGIEANATENISDDVTLKQFESGISFSDNRYSVRLLSYSDQSVHDHSQKFIEKNFFLFGNNTDGRKDLLSTD
ncbi:hypothetical protein TNCV_2423741 [Trichonephila clavipes]|nr:hypothetical protein TNCV_2423741 [Trichonephila clavipes]